jgi:glutaredoxin
MVTVTMYSRARCGLCDEARSAIEAVRATRPFRFEEVRIDGDDDLEREYGIRVPVVLVGGHEEFEATVDRTRLEALVARAG